MTPHTDTWSNHRFKPSADIIDITTFLNEQFLLMCWRGINGFVKHFFLRFRRKVQKVFTH